MTTPPVCRLAEIEEDYVEAPTTWRAFEEHINVNRIPAGCPNGYVEPPEVFVLKKKN